MNNDLRRDLAILLAAMLVAVNLRYAAAEIVHALDRQTAACGASR